MIKNLLLNYWRIFPSDEFYCLADMELPSYEDYEGFPQYENGVGLMKSFEYEVEEELEKIKIPIKTEGKFIIATGTLAYEFICDIVNKIKKKFINLELVVIPIENNFFGKTITVSGLVTGIDLINQLIRLSYLNPC